MLNFGFLAPENILYPMGRLKVARGSEGVLGAQFSIAGERGDVLPDRLMGGTRHLLCSPGLSSALARGLFSSSIAPACSLSRRLQQGKVLGDGGRRQSILSLTFPKAIGVQSRVPFGVPPLWHCAPWGYVAIKPLVLPQLFHERQ